MKEIFSLLISLLIMLFDKYPLVIVGFIIGIPLTYYGGYVIPGIKTIKQEADCILIAYKFEEKKTDDLSKKLSSCIKSIDPYMSNSDFIKKHIQGEVWS